MEWLYIILFGIVQGITEFLPISSSGHLTLFQYYSEYIPESLTLNIAVHVGTLFTILYFYRKEILRLLKGLFSWDQEALKDIGFIIAAVIPTAIIGLFLKKFAPGVLLNPLVAGICLVATGCVLYSTNWLSGKDSDGISFSKAVILGLAQGVAVLPGISRSGLTIVTALWLNIEKTQAARFSFLISVPAIMGAALLDALTSEETVEWAPLLVGAFVSFVVGLGAIYLVVILTQKQKLAAFSYYVWLVGALVLGQILLFA